MEDYEYYFNKSSASKKNENLNCLLGRKQNSIKNAAL